MKIFLNSLITFMFYVGSIIVFSLLSKYIILSFESMLLISFITISIWNILLCVNKKYAQIFEFIMIIILGTFFIKISIFYKKLFTFTKKHVIIIM